MSEEHMGEDNEGGEGQSAGFRRVSLEEAGRLYVAAIVGVPALASELEALGLSDADESLADATVMRPELLAEVERLKSERGSEG